MAAATDNPALLALREQFDGAFALAPQPADAARLNMLALRVGGDPYAMQLDQVAGLHADRRILPLPTAAPSLLGVTGFRGQIVPVHDLAVLLGHSRGAPPRWLVLVRCAAPLALAFDQFESHFSVAAGQIMRAGQPDGPAPLRDAVQAAQALRPIIDLTLLHQEIERLADSIRRQRRKPS